MTLPFSILPLVLAGCFALVWAFIVRLECEEQLDAARHEGEAPSGVVYFGGGSVGITCNGGQPTRLAGTLLDKPVRVKPPRHRGAAARRTARAGQRCLAG
jgi:hypothetical protein